MPHRCANTQALTSELVKILRALGGGGGVTASVGRRMGPFISERPPARRVPRHNRYMYIKALKGMPPPSLRVLAAGRQAMPPPSLRRGAN